MRQKIIIAIDSFKGCLTSQEANQAAAEGVTACVPDAGVIQVPVSDGGEGWLAAFQAATGGALVTMTVCDPLMRPVTAHYLVHDGIAVIEMAQASGLTLLSPEERDPWKATSYGTGQLVADAVRRGCRDIIIGLGGSATSDCGIGMLHAVIDSFTRQTSIARSRWDGIHELDGIRFTIATDVTNPLCGDHGAAHVFAPRRVLPLRWCSALTLVPDVLRNCLPVISATTGKNSRGLERRGARLRFPSIYECHVPSWHRPAIGGCPLR